MMSDVRCQCTNCDQAATTHITRAERRRSVEVLHFCELHGSIHLEQENDWYLAKSRVGAGGTLEPGSGVAFEIDVLFRDEIRGVPSGQNYLHLVECGGHRTLRLCVDNSIAFSVDFELQGYRSPRPLTHQVMVALISSLGGELERVEIDKFFPARQLYEAKLHIKQMNLKRIIDVRPSDALVLAIICNAPIVVSNDVIDRIPR